jgi:hypothetical protein
MEAVSDRDFLQAYITTSLQPDPDWRQKVRHYLSGEGISEPHLDFVVTDLDGMLAQLCGPGALGTGPAVPPPPEA